MNKSDSPNVGARAQQTPSVSGPRRTACLLPPALFQDAQGKALSPADCRGRVVPQ